jgi:hypothetical protein
MNEIIETTPAAKKLQNLLEKKLTLSQTRELAIVLGGFEKGSCQIERYEFSRKIKDFFGREPFNTIIFIGKVRTHDIQLFEFCKNKFNINKEIIQIVDEGMVRPELFDKGPVAIIFADVCGFSYNWISKELLKRAIPFAEAVTSGGNRKRKLTPRTLYRAINEIYFQIS